MNHLPPDTQQTKSFLAALNPNGPFAFATFADSSVSVCMAKRRFGAPDELMADLSADNELGGGVFVTVNETDGLGYKSENVVRVRAVFVDLDGANVAPVLAWTLAPHMVVESSRGRWHAYWLVDGLPLEQFRVVQKALAAEFCGDASVNDLARVMRLPGFFHRKQEPFMSRLHKVADDLTRYPHTVILEALGVSAPAARAREPEGPASGSGTGLIWEGERNSTLTRIAGSFRAAGSAEGELGRLLLKVNTERCAPPLDESEVLAIAKSVSRYAAAGGDALWKTLNDAGNAQRFVRQHGADLCFDHTSRQWLVWHHGHWVRDEEGGVTERAKSTAGSIFAEAAAATHDKELRTAVTRHAERSLNRQRLQSMLSLATSDPQVAIRAEALDRDDMLLGVRNGVVDLSTGEFRDSSRDDLMTMRCGTLYDAAAQCPEFDKFLHRVMGGDAELIAFMQRLAGYVLTGRTDEHCLGFLYGHGANGKSTFLDVMLRLLGDYAVQAQPETFMPRQRGAGASSDIARLAGKRMVVSNEVCEGAHLEENLVKQVVGGDRVTARFLYQEHFEFTPKFKLLIAGNHKPVIKGDDDGIWRRIRLIPFDQSIPEAERDRRLGSRLALELPGILNWAIAGCLEWQKEGLRPPPAILDASNEYRGEMDMLMHWIEDRCRVGAARAVSSKGLYGDYKQWCERGGIRPMTQPAWGRKMTDRGFQRVHKRNGTVYTGIDLKIPSGSHMSVAA